MIDIFIGSYLNNSAFILRRFEKGFARDYSRSVLLTFFKSYIKHELKKKNCNTVFLLID